MTSTTENPFGAEADSPDEPVAPEQKTKTPRTPPKAQSKVTPPTPPAAPKTPPAARPGSDKFSAAGDPDDPFASPRGAGSGERITDHMEELLLVRPIEQLHDIVTEIGLADPMSVDFAVLTGEDAGHVAEGAMVYGKVLINELTRVLDGPQPFLLGRLSMGTAKKGKNAPYIFMRPDEEEMVIAREFLRTTNF